jgi:hypothetical protein
VEVIRSAPFSWIPAVQLVVYHKTTIGHKKRKGLDLTCLVFVARASLDEGVKCGNCQRK